MHAFLYTINSSINARVKNAAGRTTQQKQDSEQQTHLQGIATSSRYSYTQSSVKHLAHVCTPINLQKMQSTANTVGTAISLITYGGNKTQLATIFAGDGTTMIVLASAQYLMKVKCGNAHSGKYNSLLFILHNPLPFTYHPTLTLLSCS